MWNVGNSGKKKHEGNSEKHPSISGESRMRKPIPLSDQPRDSEMTLPRAPFGLRPVLANLTMPNIWGDDEVLPVTI